MPSSWPAARQVSSRSFPGAEMPERKTIPSMKAEVNVGLDQKPGVFICRICCPKKRECRSLRQAVHATG